MDRCLMNRRRHVKPVAIPPAHQHAWLTVLLDRRSGQSQTCTEVGIVLRRESPGRHCCYQSVGLME